MTTTKGDLVNALGTVSIEQLQRATNEVCITVFCTEKELNTAMTASTTSYWPIYLSELSRLFLTGAIVRSEAAGVGSSTTLGLYKAGAGIAVTSAVRIAGCSDSTDFDLSNLTNSTNSDMALHTGFVNSYIDYNNIIIAKIVTAASETLKPPVLRLTFRRG